MGINNYCLCARCHPELLQVYGLRKGAVVQCKIHGFEDALNVTSMTMWLLLLTAFVFQLISTEGGAMDLSDVGISTCPAWEENTLPFRGSFARVCPLVIEVAQLIPNKLYGNFSECGLVAAICGNMIRKSCPIEEIALDFALSSTHSPSSVC